LNVIGSEIQTMVVEAKICGCSTKEKSISYSFAEPAHILCLEKRDIILAQIHACEKLLNDMKDEVADLVIKSEIVELTLVLSAIKSNKNSKPAYCSSYGCKNNAIILCSICYDFYSCSYIHACLHIHPVDEFHVLK
jgi:hypothetical protein